MPSEVLQQLNLNFDYETRYDNDWKGQTVRDTLGGRKLTLFLGWKDEAGDIIFTMVWLIDLCLKVFRTLISNTLYQAFVKQSTLIYRTDLLLGLVLSWDLKAIKDQ